LEGYICGDLKNILCKTHRGLVLLTQYEHQQSHDDATIDKQQQQQTRLVVGDDDDEAAAAITEEAIRSASLRTSLPLRQLAIKLAEYDAVEAVQAKHDTPWHVNDDAADDDDDDQVK
jgi:hypothetical protein